MIKQQIFNSFTENNKCPNIPIIFLYIITIKYVPFCSNTCPHRWNSFMIPTCQNWLKRLLEASPEIVSVKGAFFRIEISDNTKGQSLRWLRHLCYYSNSISIYQLCKETLSKWKVLKFWLTNSGHFQSIAVFN